MRRSGGIAPALNFALVGALRRRSPIIALLVATGIFLFVHYGAVLRAPDAHLFSDGGDGLKNYYTFLYHVKHDRSAWEFEGMNHPYGEHVFYTDGHPLLSWVMRALAVPVPAVAEHGVGILNLLMLLAIPCCVVVLFALLRSLGVRSWMAAAGALGISILAPQATRLHGHFALSYSMFLPLTWLIWNRIHHARKWGWWLVMLFMNGLLWWGTHAYLGAMSAAFLAMMAVGHALVWRKEWRKDMWTLIIGAALPLLIFRAALFFTDHHEGRTEHPSGFFNYTAEPDDILLPMAGPLRNAIDHRLPGLISQEWEAYAYIGLGSILVLMAWGIVARRRRKQGLPVEQLPAALRAAWWSSLALLLFAFCIPFRDIPGLLKWFPIAEQFRSVGRFTWPFYFTATITAVLLADRWSARLWEHGRRRWSIALGVALPLLLAWEGLPLHDLRWQLERSANLFSLRQAPPDLVALWERVPKDRYQALLPLPFFNVTSEAFSRPVQQGALKAALPLSFHLQLPILGGQLTRASVPDSKRLLQLISPRFLPKPISKDLPGPKPFLIAWSGEELTPLELGLLRSAMPVDSSSGIRLYELSREELFRNTAGDEWTRFGAIRPGLKMKDGFEVRDSSRTVVYLPLDDLASSHSFRGAGGYEGHKQGDHTLVSARLNGVHQGETMIASAWFFNDMPNALDLGLALEVEQRCGDGSAPFVTVVRPDESEVIDDDWTFAELPFTAICDAPEVQLKTSCTSYLDRPLFVDDVLIRPVGMDVYRVDTLADGRIELYLNGLRVPAR